MEAEVIVAAVGIGVSLLFSILSLVYARQSNARAAEDHERDVERELVRQATQISAWVAHRYRIEDGAEQAVGNALMVNNASPDAIYNAEFEVLMHARPTTLKMHLVPPGRHFAQWRGYDKKASFPFALLSDVDEVEKHGHLLRPFTVSPDWKVTKVTFEDATGRRWCRAEGAGIVSVR